MPAQKPAHRTRKSAPHATAAAKQNSNERPLTLEEEAFINKMGIAPESLSGMAGESMYSLLLSLLREILILTESYYTKDKFLSTFGVCPNTAKSWMKKKGLPYIHLGNIILYKKTDVDAFFMKFRRVDEGRH